MSRVILAVLIALFCFTCTAALASNPADPTADFRYSGDFAKFAWDDGPWYAMAIKEIGNRTSLLALHWENEKGDCVENEYAVTKRFTANGTLELGLLVDDWNRDPDRIGGMVDWTDGKIGFGAILPATDHPAKGEVRYHAGKVSFYLAKAESDCATANYGIGITSGTTRLDFAYSDNDATWYFRACAPYGKWRPELRTKWNKDDTFIGFGLGYCFQ